jgi:hypothetical protein
MLGRGLTEDGAAQALGWTKSRVTARVKILELPERAQQLIGEGVIALSAVDQLRAIGAVAPALLDAVIAYLDDGNAWAAERLVRKPGWVLDAAMRHTGDKTFAAYLQSASSHEIAELRLGKKTEQLYAEAEKLHRQLDRYAYGPPPIRFTEADVDQARAAGVLIEFERGRPIIVDRSLYRELVKGAVKRTHDELQTKAAAAAQEKKTARSAKTPADPLAAAKRDRDAQLRELTDQAHGANLDLGAALMHGRATVDPSDTDVARFFVLCRRLHRTNYADRLTMRISRVPYARKRRRSWSWRRQSTQRSRLWRVRRTECSAPRWRMSGRRRSCLRARDGACGAVDTLAMADEAVASSRRPGAAAVRPTKTPRRPSGSRSRGAARIQGGWLATSTPSTGDGGRHRSTPPPAG